MANQKLISPDSALRIQQEVEQQYAWPPEVHFKRHRIPPDSLQYIGPDDFLQVSIYTTSATTGLTLALRYLDPQGTVHYQTESLDGVSTATLTTKIFRLTEGWLLGACVSNLGGGLADQVCFVAIALQQSGASSVAPHTMLAQGYASNLFSIDWPPAYVRGPASTAASVNFFEVSQQINTLALLAFSTAGDTFGNGFWLGGQGGSYGHVMVNVTRADNLTTNFYQLGVYSSGGVLLGKTAQVNLTSAGYVSIAMTTTLVLNPGKYYFAASAVQANTAKLAAVGASGYATFFSDAAIATGAVFPASVTPPADNYQIVDNVTVFSFWFALLP